MKICFQLLSFEVIQFLDLLKGNKNDKKLKTNRVLASLIGVEATIQDFVVLLLYQGNRAIANLLALLYRLSEILRGRTSDVGHLYKILC
jgi:hypothetical protein